MDEKIIKLDCYFDNDSRNGNQWKSNENNKTANTTRVTGETFKSRNDLNTSSSSSGFAMIRAETTTSWND